MIESILSLCTVGLDSMMIAHDILAKLSVYPRDKCGAFNIIGFGNVFERMVVIPGGKKDVT